MSTKTYKVVRDFEERLAEFCGSKFAVTVDSGSSALLLCCTYVRVSRYDEIIIPSRTYPSVPCAIIHSGGRVAFKDKKWSGAYYLEPTKIRDSSKRLSRGCHVEGDLTCLSLHSKKVIPIGRGGVILTDEEKAYDWFKCARFDGRHEKPLEEDTLACIGYNCYMTPEQAARGMVLMDFIGDGRELPDEPYQDLSRYSMYTEANR